MNNCTLKLYIRGKTGRFLKAVDQVRVLCDELLGHRYRLDVIDLAESPQLAQRLNIFMVPTLIKDAPDPPQRFVGSFDRVERLRNFLLQIE